MKLREGVELVNSIYRHSLTSNNGLYTTCSTVRFSFIDSGKNYKKKWINIRNTVDTCVGNCYYKWVAKTSDNIKHQMNLENWTAKRQLTSGTHFGAGSINVFFRRHLSVSKTNLNLIVHYKRQIFDASNKVELIDSPIMESLILAQDERWRRA